MAEVTLQYTMNDGEVLTANLETEADHPDALDMLCTRVQRLLKDALTDVLAVHRAYGMIDDDEDGDDTPEVTV